MSNVQTVTYAENFKIDLSSGDALLCDGVKVENNVLRGFHDYEPLDTRKEYMGIAGVNSKYLFVHTNRILRKYDGDATNNVMMKMPVINAISDDARCDVYRDAIYIAFDDDGIIKYDESLDRPGVRWSFYESAGDVAVVNERVIMLTNDGLRLRFGDSGGRLYSDGETTDIVPSITLPSAVQAIQRYDNNTLYALGNTCYKLTFSADEQEIKIKTIADNVGEVVLHSVVHIGDKIVFSTRNKLYILHKDKLTPIFTELNNVIDDYADSRASAWRGRYVLTIPYLQGRRGYVLDVDKRECVSAFCHDVKDVCVYDGRDVMVKNDGELVRFVDHAYRSGVFTRTRIDFGNSRRKFLRRLNVTTLYDVDVTITDGNGVKRVYRLRGSDKPQNVNVYGSGRAFDMEIRSLGQMEVTRLTLVAETYKEEGYYGTYSNAVRNTAQRIRTGKSRD